MEELLNGFVTDTVMQQRLAKYLALRCLRTTFLEDLHGGKSPKTKTGDYSDVTVHTPDEVIPWNDISRFNNAEMKALMIDVVNCSYKFIHDLFDEDKVGKLLLELAKKDPEPDWDTPQLVPSKFDRALFDQLPKLPEPPILPTK